MKFVDNEHKKFFLKKLEEAKKCCHIDVYYKSLIYALSICETTRNHFYEIFDLSNGEVNIDSIQKEWQTSTSLKVTRMALNLWNDNLIYDSEEELEDNKISSKYAPSEIFCCGYAPYFWEAIKIRYPEYTNDKNICIDTRVGNIERVSHYVEKKINNIAINDTVGLYIRSDSNNDAGSIFQQKKTLEKFCEKNGIENIIEYIDVGKSGLDKDRKALWKMIQDIKNNIINTIITRDITRLFRNPIEASSFLAEPFMKNIEVISLDNSTQNLKEMLDIDFTNRTIESTQNSDDLDI